jgi:hypothetical protein
VEVAKWHATHNRMSKWQRKGKALGPPTTQASSAAARSSRPGVASRARQNKGGKNKITSNEGGAPIIVVKLLRTDTTLDLSQKARVVKKPESPRGVSLIYPQVDRARTIKGTRANHHRAVPGSDYIWRLEMIRQDVKSSSFRSIWRISRLGVFNL